ncbi:hypothetical protein NFI96_019684 [Prochilodus magdalenae]|nr:hypothetical protein NFI96_019684 [Prochilodus magdalenae]
MASKERHFHTVEPAEEVVYSEVRTNRVSPLQSTPEPEGGSSAALLARETAMSHAASYKRATICLGLLCALLLTGVVGMSVTNIIQVSQYGAALVRKLQQLNVTHDSLQLSMASDNQALKALNHNLTNENRVLRTLYTNESTAHWKVQAEKAALEKEKEELTVQRDQFNNTLMFITRFLSFPVHAFCQLNNGETYCEPCRKDWIQNGSSCYLFYRDTAWKTWAMSRLYCKDLGGDLVTIENTEEQEFIQQHTAHYGDNGYWIGLHNNNGNWVWITGSTLQNGFWIDPSKQSYDSCAVSKPSRDAQKSWMPTACGMYNKWICEMRALEWPRQV